MRPGNPKVEDIDDLAALLHKAGVDFGVEDVADALWLASHMGDLALGSSAGTQSTATTAPPSIRGEFMQSDDPEDDDPVAQLSLPKPSSQQQPPTQPDSGIPIKAPAAPALRIRLELARSLRPLRQTVPSLGRMDFDEAATVEQIAEQQIWSPVLTPAPERWLEVALVVEAMGSLPLWEKTITEFQTLLERQGAFRRVTTWRLQATPNLPLQLFPNWRDTTTKQRPRQAKHLWDPAKRRLILLLSDCASAAWHQGTVLSWLETCSQQAPTAVIQLLPERLWPQTALGRGTPIWLTALARGTVTANLSAQYRSSLLQQLLPQPAQPFRVPVITLEAEPMKQWAKVVAGSGESRAVGVQFDLRKGPSRQGIDAEREGEEHLGGQEHLEGEEHPPSPEERVQRFWTTASLMAQRLAGLMSAAPVSPPIVDLIRQTLLPKAEAVHVAEVYMGGLMQAKSASVPDGQQTPPLQYDFAEEVRNLLSDAVPRRETESVLDAVSHYIAERLGLNTKNFEALLRLDFQGDPEAEDMVIPFAEVAAQTLERMGGDYAAIAQQLATAPKVAPPPPRPDPDDLFPLLQTYRFREALLTVEPEQIAPPETASLAEPFEFETATLSVVKRAGAENRPELTLYRRHDQGLQLIQPLPDGIELAMVQIPGGTFTMGSPEDEESRSNDEGPQHQVTLQPFLMGKYPITQAQWRTVASLPPVERELENPDPARFKGDNRPVEQVSWDEAVEFCARLSQHSGRDYRLPSEAEWEYACRAGTTTPFHFGETLTPELANYDGNYGYGDGPKGEFRETTTTVGSFPANGFGLYDMHGNVWEWCQDTWHDSYDGAPIDGSPWISSDERKRSVLRGGSWYNDPEGCRSAIRDRGAPDFASDIVGFRVVCGLAR